MISVRRVVGSLSKLASVANTRDRHNPCAMLRKILNTTVYIYIYVYVYAFDKQICFLSRGSLGAPFPEKLLNTKL